MAMLFFDSCGDNYTTGTGNNSIVTMYWASTINSANPTVSLTAGRNGYGFILNEPGLVRPPNISVPGNGTTNVIIGFAIQLDIGSADSFLNLADWGIQLGVSLSGAIHIQIGGSGITSSASGVFSFNTWHYLELKVNSISGTSNYVVRLDEAVILSGSGAAGSSNPLLNIQFGDTNVNYNKIWIDDVYICDSTGSAPCNDFLGDCVVEVHMPNAVGYTTTGTPNGAASDYLCVQDTTPDLDTTYVTFSTAGNVDTYAVGGTGLSTVYAVGIYALAKGDIASNHTVAAGLATSSSSLNFGNTYGVPSVNYNSAFIPFSFNPFTSSPWAVSDLTGLQPAFKVVS